MAEEKEYIDIPRVNKTLSDVSGSFDPRMPFREAWQVALDALLGNCQSDWETVTLPRRALTRLMDAAGTGHAMLNGYTGSD